MARKPVHTTPFGERLASVRQKLGYGKDRQGFADLFGMKADSYGSYERGKTEPKIEFYEALRSRFQINLNWLLTGEGDMQEVDAGNLSETETRLLAKFRELPDRAHEGALALMEHAKKF